LSKIGLEVSYQLSAVATVLIVKG